MSDRTNPPSGNGTPPGRFQFTPRTGAILIMIAGVIGFVFSRIQFGDQVICLFASTLVTLTGLGLLFMLRKGIGIASRQAGPGQQGDHSQPKNSYRAPYRGKMPSGLRATARGVRLPVQSPMIVTPDQQNGRDQASIESSAQETVDLLQAQVVTVLEGQGAQVQVESQRENRSILNITTGEGQMYQALVLEGTAPVDVADVRAIQALVSNSKAARGYLIAGGLFTPEAYDWAGKHHIRLVSADEMDELSI